MERKRGNGKNEKEESLQNYTGKKESQKRKLREYMKFKNEGEKEKHYFIF